jgi:hypothetical protein
MSELINVTETGGMAVVILGKEFDIPSDYAYHPQVMALLADKLPTSIEELSAKIPQTAKIVLIGGEIPGPQFGNLRTVFTRRSLTFVQRRNAMALEDALKNIVPIKNIRPAVDQKSASNGDQAKKKDMAPKGSIQTLVKEADLNKGSAEEARRLFGIAQQRGIPTTIPSLAQAIAVAKRKGGRTEPPRSIMSAQQNALKTLDEAISGLQLIREYVAQTEELNLELNRKLEAFKAILK